VSDKISVQVSYFSQGQRCKRFRAGVLEACNQLLYIGVGEGEGSYELSNEFGKMPWHSGTNVGK
jgi:hypothetical protein